MNLQKFVERVAKSRNVPFEEAKEQVVTVLELMCEEIDMNSEATFHGFGCYGIKVIVDSH